MIKRPTSVVLTLALLFAQGSIASAQDNEMLALVVGNGKLLDLKEPAASLFVGDSGVISIQAVGEDMVFVTGLKPGKTNLLALDDENRLIIAHTITVRNLLNKLIGNDQDE